MCEGGGNRVLINEKFKSEVTILDDWRRGVYYWNGVLLSVMGMYDDW